jgi:hypothetical protein
MPHFCFAVLGSAGAATLTTSAAPASASTISSTLTLPINSGGSVQTATDGLELALDAATLEQLRASGDGVSLVDAGAFGDAMSMQVDGIFDEEEDTNIDCNSMMVQLDGPADETDGIIEGLEEQELPTEDGNIEGEEQQILQQLDHVEAGEVEAGEQHGFEEMLETGDVAGGIGEEEAYETAADALAAAGAEGFAVHIDGGAHIGDMDVSDPAAAYILQVIN